MKSLIRRILRESWDGIESNVDDEGFSEIEKRGIKMIEDVIAKSATDADLIDNLPHNKSNLWKSQSKVVKYWSDSKWLSKIKIYFGDNTLIKIYLDLLNVGGRTWKKVVKFSKLYQKIINNEDISLEPNDWWEIKNHFNSEFGKYNLYNPTRMLSKEEEKKISSKLKVDRSSIKLKGDDYYFEKIKNYLSKEKIDELPSSVNKLLTKLFKEKEDIPSDLAKRKTFFIDKFYGKLKEEFKEDINIDFYLDIMTGVKKYTSRKGGSFTWSVIHDRQKTLFEIINNRLKEKPSPHKFIQSKDIFKKIIDKELPYIFSKDGVLNKDEEDIIKDYIENTYESTFTELGFSKRDSSEMESRIHTLRELKYNLTDEITSNRTDGDIAEDLIKNIKSTLGKNPNIIKYDLVADKNFYSENGKRIIIKKGSKIEVKDMNYSDSYFAEMLASPVKQTDSVIRRNPKYLEKYNKVITKVLQFLKTYKVNLPTQFKNQLSGMILSNNVYVPNKDGNIKLYLSPQGRNNIKKQIRIAVRYSINMDNINNFYRIGDGIWETSNGKKSKPEVMYPLTNKNLLKK